MHVEHKRAGLCEHSLLSELVVVTQVLLLFDVGERTERERDRQLSSFRPSWLRATDAEPSCNRKHIYINKDTQRSSRKNGNLKEVMGDDD